jgi:hypothetical protein
MAAGCPVLERTANSAGAPKRRAVVPPRENMHGDDVLPGTTLTCQRRAGTTSCSTGLIVGEDGHLSPVGAWGSPRGVGHLGAVWEPLKTPGLFVLSCRARATQKKPVMS